MKINIITACIALACTVVACTEKDTVPKVADAHAPVVDGQKMTSKDFLNKYCSGKTSSSTCEEVKNAMAKDATKGALPKGW